MKGDEIVMHGGIRKWMILAGRRAARLYDSRFAVVQCAVVQDGGWQLLGAPPLAPLVILTLTPAPTGELLPPHRWVKCVALMGRVKSW